MSLMKQEENILRVIREVLQWPPGKQTYFMLSLIPLTKKKKKMDYCSRGIRQPRNYTSSFHFFIFLFSSLAERMYPVTYL